MPDSMDRERGDLQRYQLVLGGSIVVCPALAALAARYLPDCSILVWIFVFFGIYCAFILLADRERSGL